MTAEHETERTRVEQLIRDRYGADLLLTHYVVIAGAMKPSGDLRFVSFVPDGQADYISTGLLQECMYAAHDEGDDDE